ncbi:hypothetical protein [Alkaliphilus metalliredigens]|nr:hypothetical protein [Alkaliphilus metalliredigens]
MYKDNQDNKIIDINEYREKKNKKIEKEIEEREKTLNLFMKVLSTMRE